MEADAIVCYTHTGNTPRRLAGMGAGCPILAITDSKRTFHQLALAWNIEPIYVDAKESFEKTVEAGLKKLQDKGILEKGDTIVLAGGNQMLPDTEASKTLGGIMKI